MSRLTEHRSWLPSQAIQVGGIVLGVRASSLEGSLAVERHFTDVLRPDADHLVRPNFSVDFQPTGTRGSQRLGLVYRDHVVVSRRRDLRDLLLDLGEMLEAIRIERAADALAVRAAALVGPDGRACLLPQAWHRKLVLHGRRLGDLGLELIPTTTQRLPSGDGAALSRLRGESITRLPLSVWGLRRSTDADYNMRAAEGVASALAVATNRDLYGTRAALDRLAAMTGTTRFVALRPREGMDLVTCTQTLALTGDDRLGGGRSPKPDEGERKWPPSVVSRSPEGRQ